MPIPTWIKGYWGIVEAAAATRMGSGSLFGAINANRAENTLAPLSGVDAIAMGQVYSLAVQQRNAATRFTGVYSQIEAATLTMAEMLRNTPITSTLITRTIRSATDAMLTVAPKYSVRYEYNFVNDTGEIDAAFGYIHNVTLPTMSMGQLIDLINQRITANIQTPTLTSLEPGQTYRFSGKANLLVM